jgi:hypothetical protein
MIFRKVKHFHLHLDVGIHVTIQERATVFRDFVLPHGDLLFAVDELDRYTLALTF